ncbi:hypothetical protein ACFVOR_06355 [Streptomyces sp. NPDC057837]|uniref:hypothetical protein n=1 Tax=Streptomyces sp. NPDC057837 TaxID=3346260 RepID=UPI0036ABC9C7
MADVYGSTWLTAGAGSVILLDGDAGDSVVTLKHLKQPVNAIGPVDIIHDHETGISTMEEKADLVALAHRTPLTARDTAKVLFDVERPSKAQKETARRKLDATCRAGQLQKVPAAVGGPDTYAPALSPFRVAAADTGDDTDGDGALFE